MTKKKYRQQSDTTPLSESTSSVPVSHSDDEGNVIIDTTTDASAPIYEPIPELVEQSPPSYTDPVVSDTLSTLIETVTRIPDPVPVLDSVPVPEPDPTGPVTALVEEALTPVPVPVPVPVLEHPQTASVSAWSRFKSWFSRCCCHCCGCCRHRRCNDTI
jgi:hypothetical protein